MMGTGHVVQGRSWNAGYATRKRHLTLLYLDSYFTIWVKCNPCMVYVPGDVVSEASPTIDRTHPVGSCDLSHDLWKTDDVVQFWTPFQLPSGPRSTTGQSDGLLVSGCQCFDGCGFVL